MPNDAVSILRGLKPEFLEKYNKMGPRYTSYPTAPEWSKDVGQAAFREHVRAEVAGNKKSPLSLYFHIPFCVEHCLFCACNVVISKAKGISEPYVQALKAEMSLLASDLGRSWNERRPVSQIHFGGGTPTYLSPDQFRDVMGHVREEFNVLEQAEISLEADPCVTTMDHIRVLQELGFDRLSYGVQDFHAPTQEVINRVQSYEITRDLTECARELGFKSVNYDLVYGLPFQTVETFQKTLDKVLELRPDRVALYNFAYIPEVLKHQKVFDPGSFPDGPTKFAIFVGAYERFLKAGYVYIGMDHFALPVDALSRALKEGTLQRNFMGYTTQAGTDLFSFGTSSISATDRFYVQNTKALGEHEKRVQAGELPVERGMRLSDDDRLRRAAIYAIMCQGRLKKSDLESRFGIRFDETFGEEWGELATMESDGLLRRSPEGLELTVLGFVFARNVAMVFDAYLRRGSQKKYSKTL